MPYDEAKKGCVARSAAEGSVEALPCGAGRARPSVNRPSVGVCARIGLFAASNPLGGAAKAVEVGVTHDGVHGSNARDELPRDHFGARAVLGLRRKDEPRIVAIERVHHMIVVIDPARQPRTELLDERSRDFLEAAARGLRRERYVEHDHAPFQIAGARQLARRREGEIWARHEPLFRSTSLRRSLGRCRLALRMAPLSLKLDAQGLVPVIVQDHLTGEVRMQAFANEDAVRRTLQSGRATFWSRSRGEVWEKGSTSGNGVHVLRVLVDCDADSLIYVSEPEGNSCHTGAPSCFFRTLEGPSAEGLLEAEAAKGGAQTLLGALEATLEARKGSTGAASYTKSLFDGGAPAIGAKVREEGGELAHALEAENDDRVVSESADVLYHLLVGLRWRNIGLRRVLAELARRLGTSGHVEKAARSPTR